MPGFRFSETLTGFFLENILDFKNGYAIGKKKGNKIELRATITADDLDEFINDPNHRARLEGVIDCESMGEDLPVMNGFFNLFKFDREAGMRKLIYSCEFSSQSGEPYFLYGEKLIHKDGGFFIMAQDVKDDLTTLFTTIYHGDTKERPAGAGIMNFKIKRIVELFGSAEVIGAQDSSEKRHALSKFIRFVNRELEETYGGPGIDLFDLLKLLELV